MIVDQLCFGCMEARGTEPVCSRCGWRADTPASSPLYLPPGTILENQYVAGRVLGHGGFGVTYLGWDLRLARKVAIKEYLPAGVAIRAGSLQITAHHDSVRNDFDYGLARFLDEAQVLARFQGFPNIIWVVQFFQANGTAYMVMEYLDGETFEAYLSRNGGKVPYLAARTILMPVMDAMREVHRLGILHRDISPDNIFLVREGPVKVLDFGAARTAMGQRSMNLSVILKEGYAPEEQYVSNGRQGAWTDVYAMAGTMYRALTGMIPPPSIGRRRQDDLAPPSWLKSDIPPACEAVLLRALAIDANDRYQSMGEFQNALVDAENGKQPPALPLIAPGLPPLPKNLPEEPKRKAVPVPIWQQAWFRAGALGGLCLALLIGLIAALLWPKPPVDPPEAAIRSFMSAPGTITAGETAEIVWSVDPKAKASIDNGVGSISASGTYRVTPRSTTQYTLTAQRGSAKPEISTVLVTVRQPVTPPPPQLTGARILSFGPLTPALAGPNMTGLTWQTEGAKEATITPGIGLVQPSGSVRFPLSRTTEFTLSTRGSDGVEVTRTLVLEGRTAETPPAPQPVVGDPPRVSFFRTEPETIRPGQPVVLSWSVLGASTVILQPGLGAMPAQGQLRLTPPVSVTYTLFAANAYGKSTTAKAAVRVEAPAAIRPTAQLSVSPQVIQQGQAAMLGWSLTNGVAAIIEPGPMRIQQANGQFRVTPQGTTTYRLSVKGADGTIVTDEVTLQVVASISPVPNPDRGYPYGGGNGGGGGMDRSDALRTYQVMHDHSGVYLRGQVWRGCTGILQIGNGRLTYRVMQTNDGRKDDFSIPLSEVREASVNRSMIQYRQAFHIRLQSGANFNFIPQNGSPAQIVSDILRGQR